MQFTSPVPIGTTGCMRRLAMGHALEGWRMFLRSDYADCVLVTDFVEEFCCGSRCTSKAYVRPPREPPSPTAMLVLVIPGRMVLVLQRNRRCSPALRGYMQSSLSLLGSHE